MPSDPDPRLLEVSHVARRLGVGPDYVLALIHNKQLPAILLGRMWRIDAADLKAFIDKRKTKAVH